MLALRFELVVGFLGRFLRLWMLIIDVYWFSCWCRYGGHSSMGLYFKVFRRMVRIGCISLCVYGIFLVWWLHMIMVVLEGSSLVVILAKRIASIVDFRYGGWAILTPICLEDLLANAICTWRSYKGTSDWFHFGGLFMWFLKNESFLVEWLCNPPPQLLNIYVSNYDPLSLSPLSHVFCNMET